MVRRRELKGIKDIVGRVLERADPAGRRYGAEAVAAWKSIAGPDIVAHTKGFAVREGRELVVFVDSAAWANQLSLMSSDLVSRLNAHLGQKAIRSMRFTVSKKVSQEVMWEALEKETEAFYGEDEAPPAPLDSTEMDQARHVAAAVRDPALREVALRVMVRDLERKKAVRANAEDKAGS